MIKEINKKVYMSLIAEKAGDFNSMRHYLENYILKRHEDISDDERNLLSLSYKNIISSKRHSIRTIISLENKEKVTKESNKSILEYMNLYKRRLIDDLIKTCEEISTFIETNLVPFSIDDSSKAFYFKLIGDYNRYICENIYDETKKKAYIDKSLNSYNTSSIFANNLNVLHIDRLGLSLNLSVFYYEILDNHETAIQITKKILDEVKKEIENLDENNEENLDVFNIIELLQENLNMWNIEGDN